MSQNNTTRINPLGWLALFTSFGTLLCCALPILLVTLGFGAVVASLTYQLPWLVTLSENKLWLFSISGLLLAACAWALWRQTIICPTDPALAFRCQQAKRWNQRLFFGALIIWCIGFIAAFLLFPLRNLLCW